MNQKKTHKKVQKHESRKLEVYFKQVKFQSQKGMFCHKQFVLDF